ncbi:hypothetical protein ACROYT_G011274 [Oculina patagonica]
MSCVYLVYLDHSICRYSLFQSYISNRTKRLDRTSRFRVFKWRLANQAICHKPREKPPFHETAVLSGSLMMIQLKYKSLNRHSDLLCMAHQQNRDKTKKFKSLCCPCERRSSLP